MRCVGSFLPLKQVTKFFTFVSSRKSCKSSTRHVMSAGESNFRLNQVLFCFTLNTHLSLVVNVVEVFSDTWFRALALDVCSGGSGGDAAGGQAAQSGQTSAAESCSTEEQHARTGAPESETTTSVLTESV